MATGDQNDFISRLKALLPPGWFPDTPGDPASPKSPFLNTILSAPASIGASIYTIVSFAQLQTRIKTATGGFLDMIAYDYFGSRITRSANQSDTGFRNHILAEIFRIRTTRPGMIQALKDLTGRTPLIFEPTRPMDTGGYAISASMGYGITGAYGDLGLKFQSFITAYRPKGSGIPGVGGYSSSVGGYGTPSYLEYASLSMVLDAVTDSDIYATIEANRPAASICWVKILN